MFSYPHGGDSRGKNAVVIRGRVTPAWGKCGNQSGFKRCTQGFYCEPWDSNYYQCIKKPSKLRFGIMPNIPDIDYSGIDIKRVTGIGPNTCCEECGKTPRCDSYTYINDDPSGTQCYLKKSNAGRTIKIGVLSGYVTPGMIG
ncbi:Cellulose binding elicitor lectin [Phytophthora palmivora]|uniref:Cellulose binding elicitor lectin n=1 Tax=Phytophthora palmivora TaxID=4796 RepID=A0A2P4YFR7_9STRA|nr:Cellulose binding elicitor lectin [Phytophthora palmivora]